MNTAVPHQHGSWRTSYRLPEIRSSVASLAAQDTPTLFINLHQLRANYRRLCLTFDFAEVWYAVKANPAPEILRTLAELGARFDVASLSEAQACIAAGASPKDLSFGHTVKRPSDIRAAFELGVDLFAFDSAGELSKLAKLARGAGVVSRVEVPNDGAAFCLSKKFGCSADEAAGLMEHARDLGLRPAGLTFHVGSQQLRIDAWQRSLAVMGRLVRELRLRGIPVEILNMGGGLPAPYLEPIAPLDDYRDIIEQALHEAFGPERPRVVMEPGRAVVATSGVILTELLLVTERPNGESWAYLDVGRFGGLPETADCVTRYPIIPLRSSTAPGRSVTFAGPTCDGEDVLYHARDGYCLPVDAKCGDKLVVLGAGAYTASYSSVGFNGFAPLPVVAAEMPLWFEDSGD